MLRRRGANAYSEPLRIVAIGGGTGLSSLLHGFKQHMNCVSGSNGRRNSLDITAVVTVTDDGGSSGRLRREFDVLPPGDIRNCLVAMSEDEATLSRLFQYRFDSGRGLKGHTLGNLFLTALTHLTGGDFARAVQHASDVLAICGRIYPSTDSDVSLAAILQDGTRVEGETRITRSRTPIRRVRLQPSRCRPLPETLEAIKNADLITFGPGSLFTSVIPNLLVKGITDAIAESLALKVYFVNLMWQPFETVNFSAFDHIKAIHDHAGRPIVDVAVVNSTQIPRTLQRKYAAQQAQPVENDLHRLQGTGLKVVARPLLVATNKIRHDPDTIAEVAIHLAGEGRRRRTRASRK